MLASTSAASKSLFRAASAKPLSVPRSRSATATMAAKLEPAQVMKQFGGFNKR